MVGERWKGLRDCSVEAMCSISLRLWQPPDANFDVRKEYGAQLAVSHLFFMVANRFSSIYFRFSLLLGHSQALLRRHTEQPRGIY